MSLADPAPWLLLVAGAHLGFQLTVDLVVYPALGEVAPERWDRRPRRPLAPDHAGGGRWSTCRSCWCSAGRRSPSRATVGTWVAVAGGPARRGHDRGGGGADPRPAARRPTRRAGRPCSPGSARADRVRTVGAVVCVVGRRAARRAEPASGPAAGDHPDQARRRPARGRCRSAGRADGGLQRRRTAWGRSPACAPCRSGRPAPRRTTSRAGSGRAVGHPVRCSRSWPAARIASAPRRAGPPLVDERAAPAGRRGRRTRRPTTAGIGSSGHGGLPRLLGVVDELVGRRAVGVGRGRA